MKFYEFKGDLLKMMTDTKINKRSDEAEILHDF